MADVARETGLTLDTVSRALNTEGKYAIAPETRERVQATAERLGYRPNLIGKALAARSTGLILLVSPDPFAPYDVEVSRHLSGQPDRHGYSFVTGGALQEARDRDAPITSIIQPLEAMCVAAWSMLQRRDRGADRRASIPAFASSLAVSKETPPCSPSSSPFPLSPPRSRPRSRMSNVWG